MTSSDNPHRKVAVRMGITSPTGRDFESIRMDVEIEDYVRDSDANTAAAVDRVADLVEKKLVDRTEKALRDLNG